MKAICHLFQGTSECRCEYSHVGEQVDEWNGIVIKLNERTPDGWAAGVILLERLLALAAFARLRHSRWRARWARPTHGQYWQKEKGGKRVSPRE